MTCKEHPAEGEVWNYLKLHKWVPHMHISSVELEERVSSVRSQASQYLSDI